MVEEKLNAEQEKAVAHKDGPLLVVAGAGAGKTKTIAHRIRALITSGVRAENILAITFTNKAAREMGERVRHLLSGEGPWLGDRTLPFVSTFHSLGNTILRQNASAFGINGSFSIADKDDSNKLIKKAMTEVGVDPQTIEPRKILGIISKEKGRLVSVDDFLVDNYFGEIVEKVWREYEKVLRERQMFDFDDLILRPVKLFESNLELLNRYRERWHYIHIDEYQDTNTSQYRLVKLLAGDKRNVCAVGDIDQSIYSWRGADFKNVLRFEKDYPDAKVVILEENYRSTQRILESANQVIAKNEERLPKNLFTKNEEGEKITLLAALSETDEAILIAGTAARLIANNASPSSIAVLYRANFQSRALEEAMLAADVPYQVLGVRFFERKEIKDLLSYLKAAHNPKDWESISRVVNLPPRGLGKVTLAKIVSGQAASLPPKTLAKWNALLKLFAEIKTFSETNSASATLKFILRTSGWETSLKEGGAEEAERLENLRELVTLALKYDNLPNGESVEQLLADAALWSDQDELGANEGEKKQNQNAVRLMTVHAAKGLEFNTVFITGLEQDLFPHGRMGADDNERDEEEERRLFYVALTRAKRKLYLSYAETRTIYGSTKVNLPSEFLADIPTDLIELDRLGVGAAIDF